MFSIAIENNLGNKLQFVNDQNFVITHVEGLTPPASVISTGVVATMDGERQTNVRVDKRNIVITLKILTDVEQNRILLYKYFKLKAPCKIFYKNESRDVYIEGTVETFEADLFTALQEVQISIICAQPYFKALEEMYYDISQVLSAFEFPFAIDKNGIEFSVLDPTLIAKVENSGDVVTGVIIEISANGAIANPKIYNTVTRGMFGLTLKMEKGDIVRINTNKGSKKVEFVHEGITSNIMNAIMINPDWFQLEIGENFFTYDCESGNEFFNMQFSHVNMYEGV